ncbi:LysR substrate-binding domain-containing protein [Ensifer sesbaniae]|jgi:DNA-binding transcriptional LysR family regulator|uniref:LysR family transcriptional regulator n=1 Tax=Ensifer sesbaniae TaxID=1214071 RepID=UPI0015699AFE|nr:LysR substrate-binding domain-containing protein [Ensifer sesbaniae]MCK3776974.1 LysR substrate-binding domain-containing protein [Ensifer sesbaniae]NRQ17071.1 HTH-type transcriptional regulator YofA [Ensifer sesbaniae]
MHDLDIGLLRAFVVTAECGSVSGAAQRLARTQAAVSMQLRRLEDDLGARLLNRSTRGMDLTEAGYVLLPYARKMLGLSTGARRALAGRSVHGPIRFGMIEDIAVGSLPRALQRFSECHPNVALELTVAESTVLSEKLSQGQLDVAIGDPALIHGRPILAWRLPLRWVAARGFAMPDEGPLPLVTFDGVCTWRQKMIEALNGGKRPWRTVLTSASLASIQSMIEAGLGIAVLLDLNIRPNTMKILGANEGLPPAPVIELGLFAADDQGLSSQPVAALWEFLSDELQAEALATAQS